MTEKVSFFKKHGKTIAIVALIYGSIRIGFVIYSSFTSAMEEARTSGVEEARKSTADDTRRLIDQGATLIEFAYHIDEPKTTINVTTVLGDTNATMVYLTQGLTADQETFIHAEINKLLTPCENVADDKALECIQNIDFTLPPYRMKR